MLKTSACRKKIITGGGGGVYAHASLCFLLLLFKRGKNVRVYISHLLSCLCTVHIEISESAAVCLSLEEVARCCVSRKRWIYFCDLTGSLQFCGLDYIDFGSGGKATTVEFGSVFGLL